MTSNCAVAPLPVWARKTVVQKLTGAPQKFLAAFAKEHPESVRRYGGGGRNGTRIFNVAAVLAAIDGMGPEKEVAS